MTAFNPNDTAKVWQTQRPEPAVHLYLSSIGGDSAALVGVKACGYPLQLNIVAVTDWIDTAELNSAAAAVIQVDPDAPASIKRFQKLAAECDTPLIAAAYDPPLALVRSLLKSGAHDVLALPLTLTDLEVSLAPVRDEFTAPSRLGQARTGRLVSIVKSGGGVGATSLLSQLAIRYASAQSVLGRETCLIDFDVQFGDAAFQLGVTPAMSLAELIEAGLRLDGALLRSTTMEHASGLKVVAAPPVMLPLESVTSEQMMDVIDVAEREFGTVFVDLPTNWTHWSLSLVARSDLVLLVTSLSVAGLRRARRQLELIHDQGLNVDVRVVANRYEKNIFRTIKPADVRQALGRDVAYTIVDDPAVMRAAIDRGVPIDQIKRKSSVGKDVDTLQSAVAAALELER